MSESQDSAGTLLRAAREAQGLHIGALAAAIKVAPVKLEALEADRLEELPDVAFARALAQTVCRALKIDAEPVLARLPRATTRLDPLDGGLNAPFRDRPDALQPGDASLLRRPAFWATALVLLAAAVLLALPQEFWRGLWDAPATDTATVDTASAPAVNADAHAPAAAAPAEAPARAAPAEASAQAAPAETSAQITPAPPPASAAVATPAAVPSAAAAVLRAHGASWVQVRDAGGRVLLSRTLAAGESVGLDGQLPLRLTIGNAAQTELEFRGSAVDLAAATRDNVARLELR